MKEIKNKNCKACGGEYKPRSSTQQACSTVCAIAWSRAKEAKKFDREQNKAHRLAKKIFKAGDLKTRKEAAKIACHAYIRERDKNELCICCNKDLGENYHAGHFLESGNNPQIRFDESNIHGQKIYCNTYKGGNSGDYRGNLIKKIGLERVERLESMKGGTVKRSAEDYKQIESYFKDKLKALIEQ